MRRLWLLAVPIALFLFLGGCGKGNFSQKTSAGDERTFRYPLIHEPGHMDPATVQYGDVIDLTQQIFEGLVKWGEDSKIEPNLAESWDISKDGLTYTFHIRKGVTFSNGKPLTAADFKWSIERACNPGVRSETAEEYMDDIVGVKERVHGQAQDVKGVQVIDDYTLRIQISKPVPYFLEKLTYPCAFAVSKDAAPADREMGDIKEMVGTGPFTAKRYVENQVFELAANKTYHGGAPLIDAIERPILEDPATLINKYKAGELDLIPLQRQDIAALQADPTMKSQLHFYARPSTYYLAFNLKVYPPFAKREVRQAFSEAIDCNEICSKTLGGFERVANCILPPAVLGYRKDAKTLPFDPANAKKLLAQAGYANGSALPPVPLYFRTDTPDIKLVAQAIQDALSKNLNVTVELKPLDANTLIEKQNRKELAMYHMRWAADYLDPQDYLSLMLTTNGAENKQYYSNPEVDALCAQADVMPGEDPKRLALYAKAEDMILQDAAWLPIYFQVDAELISPRVHGLRDSVFGHLPHTTVSLKN